MNRTIGTLAAVVALTLAACGGGTSDTRGWSDEAFRDLMTYCQATGDFDSCALFIIIKRDFDQCSVEATYMVLDHIDSIASGEERPAATDDLMAAVLQPAGDCLEYTYAFPGE